MTPRIYFASFEKIPGTGPESEERDVGREPVEKLLFAKYSPAAEFGFRSLFGSACGKQDGKLLDADDISKGRVTSESISVAPSVLALAQALRRATIDVYYLSATARAWG
jgi:hypothetical protein